MEVTAVAEERYRAEARKDGVFSPMCGSGWGLLDTYLPCGVSALTWVWVGLESL
jgi:hypothetical protein